MTSVALGNVIAPYSVAGRLVSSSMRILALLFSLCAVAYDCTCPYGVYSSGPVNYCTYPGSGCPWDYHDENGCCCYNFSPVIVDLEGDGIELTSAAGGVVFDLTATGHPLQVGWTRPNTNDAWLALDRDGNNQIDDGSELFGNFTPQPPSDEPNGFLALAVFDQVGEGGNGDGVIDGRDLVFGKLWLWRDSNQDGVSQPRELIALSAAGIVSIDLHYVEARRRDKYGNKFKFRAKVTDRRGSHVARWAWDVFLTTGRSLSSGSSGIPRSKGVE